MTRTQSLLLAGATVTAALVAGVGLFACSDKDATDKAATDKGEAKAGKGKGKNGKAAAPKKVEPPTPVQDALVGGPYPSILLAQAWFWKDENNKPKPGPARLEIWRETPDEGWKVSRVEDGDSNVFHKAVAWDGGILTIAAEKAMLKHWKHADGKWTSSTLYEQSWGGKFDRLRDLEIGDVDGDGKDEFVIATHDAGVVVVINPDMEVGAEGRVFELDQKVDTFVHEIEIGDVDGDGKMEFFATPTDRNKANASQHGELVMYKFDGSTYVRTLVDPYGASHAKECLTADLDGDGKAELFSVLEAETDAGKNVVKPVEVRQHMLAEDGTWTHKQIAAIDDRQTRFLVAGDFDGDGRKELVAAAMKTGLYLIDSEVNPRPKKDEEPVTWSITKFDSVSSGFEHTTSAKDLDGDGNLELYVAADDQRELKRYVWNAEKNTFDKTLLARLQQDTFTWNLETGSF